MVYKSALINKISFHVFLPKNTTLQNRQKASFDTLAVTVLSGRLLKEKLTFW